MLYNILGNTKGLLGVWNDIKTDDLMSANGTTLDDSSSQQTIFYEFGETCKQPRGVSSATSNSFKQIQLMVTILSF